MANSCSHWWHCPLYFTMSVTLAVIAISASIHSPPNKTIHPNPLNQTLPHNLSFAASLSLRRHGFSAIATLLQISPEFFLSSPQSTIFAIQDSAISNVSAHPNAMKKLLKYHTSPSKLPAEVLLNKPKGTCFSTLVPQKHIAITKIDPREGPISIEINNVLISHPDLFLEGPISIHGVVGPFSSIPIHEIDHQDWEITQPPICDSNFSLNSKAIEFKNGVEWNQIVWFLSSNGYVSFAIRLHSVLDGIIQDYPDLNSVTIFAPLDYLFVTPSWPMLDRIVRSHMIPQRLTYIELDSFPEKALLGTLVPGRSLVITRSANSKRRRAVAVNGVEIVAPDSFSSEHFVIHGISGAFSMGEIPSI